MIEFKRATGKDELEQAYLLRWEVLRKPWNKPRGTETDNLENEGVTAVALQQGEVVATARAHFYAPGCIQIRYMAVSPALQGKGIGRLLLHFLEQEMQQEGAAEVMLHARENALAFYLANGYSKGEETETLYDVIRHWKMKKALTT